MNEKLNVKTINNFDRVFLLLSVDQSPFRRPLTNLLNHEQLFYVEKNLLARALKNTSSQSSIFSSLPLSMTASNN